MNLQYYHNGHLRWSLFWENPNGCAAFLACLLAWVWWMEVVWQTKPQKRVVGVAGFLALHAIEFAIWFLLAKTYSRGGLVSALCAMLIFFLPRGFAAARRGWCARHVAARLLVVCVFCIAVGFAGRLMPEYLAHDKSVTNRLDLWQGALVMINDSPFHGWGHGNGGMAYCNWYQSLDARERPVGFVNSYFEVAVEHGMHMLFIILACFCAFVLIAIRCRGRHWVASAGVCLMAWGLCNIWSSLWSEPLLWVLPGVSIILILIQSFRAKSSMPRIVMMAAGCAFLTTTAMVAAGCLLATDRAFKAIPLARAEAVLLAKRNAQGTPRPACELWADGMVFGRYFGRTIRSLVETSPPDCLVAYSPWAGNPIENKPRPDKRIFSGLQAGRVNDGKPGNIQVFILHPTVPPPSTHLSDNGDLTVCLPQFDTFGFNLSWRRWAAGNDSRLIYSPNAGQRFEADTESIEFWKTILMQ
jgi:O-antigen ligase